ncbi:MAG: mannitol dehydrogenase family protein [Paracoccaceae bacterium]
MKLSNAILSTLPETVQTPSYDRAALTPGILHIGVGNFHRAHQALYLDQLFNTGRDHDWAIVGAGVMRFDADRREALKSQDWLTTVVELDPVRLSARVIGSMIDFCEVGGEAIVDRMADPAIRIVSLTITEGGYFIDASTGGFDCNHPDIQHDAQHPNHPRTVFGTLLAGLRRRRDQGHPAFTILSCDNLPENGHITRQAVEGLAGMISGDLRQWVTSHVAFPNGMVDCITPATSDRERVLVTERFGIEDAAPVVCEPFRQWVLEDNFPLGRPALEHVGVQFVTDVTPYETMKLRILNAGHAAIAYASALLGHRYVHEAMADPDIRDWLMELMRREVIPVLRPIAGVSYEDYLQICVERFSNPAVGDTIARLCLDGSNRQPKFVLPTIAEALRAGAPIDGLTLEVALWCRYCAEAGEALDDERAAELSEAARATRDNPLAFIERVGVIGTLARKPVFAEAFASQITQLWTRPARQVLRQFTGQGVG